MKLIEMQHYSTPPAKCNLAKFNFSRKKNLLTLELSPYLYIYFLNKKSCLSIIIMIKTVYNNNNNNNNM